MKFKANILTIQTQTRLKILLNALVLIRLQYLLEHHMVAVKARRPSESILILHTADLAAFLNWSSGTPTAFSILPPYLLINSTYSGRTEEAPCKTIGKFGSLFSHQLVIF